MGIKRSLKRAIKPFTNVRGWSDYDRTKAQTEGLVSSIRNLFVPRAARYKESFTEAMDRYHLTEKDLYHRRRQFVLLFLVQLVLMLFLLYYGANMLLAKQYPGGAVAVAFAFVMFTLALRNHFWYFQIKKRKLGCTLKEYFMEGVLGVKNEQD
jgi:intracellular multiplication protein IcmV